MCKFYWKNKDDWFEKNSVCFNSVCPFERFLHVCVLCCANPSIGNCLQRFCFVLIDFPFGLNVNKSKCKLSIVHLYTRASSNRNGRPVFNFNSFCLNIVTDQVLDDWRYTTAIFCIWNWTVIENNHFSQLKWKFWKAENRLAKKQYIRQFISMEF